MNDQPEYLIPRMTARGFHLLPPLAGEHGGYVRLRESSKASSPHLWIDVAEPLDANDPSGGSKEIPATLHISLETAEKLISQLYWFVYNHYQVKSE